MRARLEGVRAAVLRHRFLTMFLLLFALIFVRYCYFGFEYYHQLDDYIQYHNYTAKGLDLQGIIDKLGLLAARPLAGLADIIVWARLFSVMIAAVAAISAMLAASACFFHDVFRRRFGTGSLFFVVYALLPLGFEGTYWVSASSRVVVGLFFVSLSLWLFERWLRDGKKSAAALFALAQLAAFGFYEQAMVLAFAAPILFAAMSFRAQRRRSLFALCGVVSLVIFVLFTRAFTPAAGSGLYGNRSAMANVFSVSYFTGKVPEVLGQLRSVFVGGGFYTLVKGAWRGAKIFAAQPNFLFAAVVLALCAALYGVARVRGGETAAEGETRARPRAALVMGALLALAPLAPFFLLVETWFSFRGAVMSFAGLALIADTLLRLVLNSGAAKPRLGGERTGAAITAVIALICCVAAISELSDYRDTTAHDMAFVGLLADTVLDVDSEARIAILNVEPSYLENQNYVYHEHIHGITESGWALYGGLEARVGFDNVRSVTPLPRNPMYRPWNCAVSRLENFDVLYLYLDGALIEVTAQAQGVFTREGEYVGYVWEEDNYGYLELASALG